MSTINKIKEFFLNIKLWYQELTGKFISDGGCSDPNEIK